MPQSLIHNVERQTGQIIPAATEESVVLTSASRGWKGPAVELHDIAAAEQPEHYVRTHRLMLHVGRPTQIEWREGGGSWKRTVLNPGHSSMLTDGSINQPRWHDPLKVVAIGLDPVFLEGAFGDAIFGGHKIEFTPLWGTLDPTLARFAEMFHRELADPQFAEALFGETVAIAFARYLMTNYSTAPRAIVQPRGALTGQQLQRIVSFLHLAIVVPTSLLPRHLDLPLDAPLLPLFQRQQHLKFSNNCLYSCSLST